MTQMMIEQLTQEEYSNLLAYGDPVSADTVVQYQTGQTGDDLMEQWISTLDSTTFPDLTFGYQELVRSATLTCMSTAV